MAGHSKWAKIRHQKGINDAKKGKVFSKLAQQITISARDGGADPAANFNLRLLMDKAKSVSMPAENVQRAIVRGSGAGGEAVELSHIMYEGYAPGGASVIVEVLTDNKNRTVAEIRNIFTERGGNMGESGSVSWNFDQKGEIRMRPAKYVKSDKYGEADKIVDLDSESVMMELMEIDGVLDIQEYEDIDDMVEGSDDSVKFIDVYTEPKSVGAVRDKINQLGYILRSAELIWVAKNSRKLEGAQLNQFSSFVEAIEDNDDVQNVWSDVKEE